MFHEDLAPDPGASGNAAVLSENWGAAERTKFGGRGARALALDHPGALLLDLMRARWRGVTRATV
jgi:hypothetical protein